MLKIFHTSSPSPNASLPREEGMKSTLTGVGWVWVTRLIRTTIFVEDSKTFVCFRKYKLYGPSILWKAYLYAQRVTKSKLNVFLL